MFLHVFNTHKGDNMKTVGDKIEKFAVTGVNPGSISSLTLLTKASPVSGRLLFTIQRTLHSYVQLKSLHIINYSKTLLTVMLYC